MKYVEFASFCVTTTMWFFRIRIYWEKIRYTPPPLAYGQGCGSGYFSTGSDPSSGRSWIRILSNPESGKLSAFRIRIIKRNNGQIQRIQIRARIHCPLHIGTVRYMTALLNFHCFIESIGLCQHSFFIACATLFVLKLIL